jgi:hypothetical protein
MKHNNMVSVGAWSLIIFAVLLVGISIWIDFLIRNQPILFDLQAVHLFPVREGSSSIHTLLSLYAALPLLLIPAAIGTYYAFAQKYEVNMRVGVYFATAGAIALTLSLMMIPSISWHLVSAMQTLPVQDKPVIIAILQGTYNYLGRYVGDILGLGCTLVWVIMTSIVMLKSKLLPRSIALSEAVLAGIMVIVLLLHYTNIMPNIIFMIHVTSILALWAFLGGMGLMCLKVK